MTKCGYFRDFICSRDRMLYETDTRHIDRYKQSVRNVAWFKIERPLPRITSFKFISKIHEGTYA